MDTPGLLHERAKTHGDFENTARIAQRFRRMLADELSLRIDRGQRDLSDIQREALEHAVGKVARILSGDADFADHWRDGAGYLLLPIRFDPEADAQGSYTDAVRAIGAELKRGRDLPPESPLVPRRYCPSHPEATVTDRFGQRQCQTEGCGWRGPIPNNRTQGQPNEL